MTDDIAHDETGYDELDWRLQTYVAARLAPSPDAVQRMRRAVVARATDIAAVQAFEARRLAEEAERGRFRPRGALDWIAASRRRGAAALLAASLVIGSSAAAFAASPGSPLYPTRVWLETLFLPAQQDARAAAHVDHLEQRVEDAEHAAGGGDPNGVSAALAAYRLEVEAALLDAGGDPERLAQLRAALDVHVLLLEQLERDAPEGSQSAIHEAISDNKAATKEIDKSGARTAAPPQPTLVPTTQSGQDPRGDR